MTLAKHRPIFVRRQAPHLVEIAARLLGLGRGRVAKMIGHQLLAASFHDLLLQRDHVTAQPRVIFHWLNRRAEWIVTR